MACNPAIAAAAARLSMNEMLAGMKLILPAVSAVFFYEFSFHFLLFRCESNTFSVDRSYTEVKYVYTADGLRASSSSEKRSNGKVL